ncbi:MAG: sensor histidine kinase [Terriglobales bacterium]
MRLPGAELSLIGVLLTGVLGAQIPAPVSVAEARAALGQGRPAGVPLHVDVVLNSDPVQLSANAALVFAQDSSGGLELFTRQVHLFQGLRRGDRIAAWGAIKTYKEMPELEVIGLHLLAHGTVPRANDVLTSNLASDAYLGMLVRVAGKLQLTQKGNSTGVLLVDRAGPVAIFLRRNLLADPRTMRALASGGSATVVGVATRVSGTNEVEPNRPEDVDVVLPRPQYEIWAMSGLLALVAGVAGMLWWRRREAEARAQVLSQVLFELRHSQAELQTSEESLRHLQKMEAVGQLAGGIAHDFNNLLTVIGGQAQLLSLETEATSKAKYRAEMIIQATDRATILTKQLLAFGRRQVLRLQKVDLNALAQETSNTLQRVLGEKVAVSTRLRPDLGAAMADPGQLDQILLNLAINARDAMPDGGSLVIETGELDLDSSFPGEPFTAPPGRFVMLAVCDTGIGMDEETRARMFEPFFTTKPTGKGTGLGLAMVYGIVKQSGGYIWVESTPGQGTAVRIYLPRMAEPTAPTATPMSPT